MLARFTPDGDLVLRLPARQYCCLAKHAARATLLSLWDKKMTAETETFRAAIARHLQTAAAQIGGGIRSAIDEHGLASKAKILGAVPAGKSYGDGLRAAMHQPAKALATSGAAHEWELSRARSKREIEAIATKGAKPPAAPLPADVLKGIDKHVQDLLDQPWLDDLADEVKAKILDALTDGIDDGLSGPEVADKINEMLGGNADSQAMSIARTESTGLLNSGADTVRDSLVAAGHDIIKEWSALDDDSTRETHAEADGQQRPQGDDFDIGGEPAAYPGDPRLSPAERCNCRCTVLTVFGSDAGDES